MKVYVVMQDSFNGEDDPSRISVAWIMASEEKANARVKDLNAGRRSSYSPFYFVEMIEVEE